MALKDQLKKLMHADVPERRIRLTAGGRVFRDVEIVNVEDDFIIVRNYNMLHPSYLIEIRIDNSLVVEQEEKYFYSIPII